MAPDATSVEARIAAADREDAHMVMTVLLASTVPDPDGRLLLAAANAHAALRRDNERRIRGGH